MHYRIRPVRVEDAEQINAMRIRPEVGRYLLALPTERVEFTRSFLEGARPGVHIFVAEREDARVLGMATLQQYGHPRRKHVGEIGIFVDLAAQGIGVGRALMDTLIDLADNWLLLDRLELSVFVENERARSLYESLGFEREVLAKKLCVLDGTLADEFHMGRLRPGAQLPDPCLDSPDRKAEPVADAPSYRIRPRRREDSEDLARLQIHEGVFETLGTLPSINASMLNAWYDGLDRYSHHLLVAELTQAPEEGKVVGIANLSLNPNPRLAHKGELSLAVLPAHQGMGLGRRLMESIIDVADNWMALRRLELTVSANNLPGQSLYRSLGFEEEGRYRRNLRYQGGYSDEIAMAWLRP